MDKVITVSSAADYTTARCQDLVLQLWHKQTTLEGVAALRGAIGSVAEESPQGLRLLIVVEPAASMPPRDARAKIADFMTDYKSSIRATALAFEGVGFRAASIRAVVTGLNLLAHHPFPYGVFSSIPEALNWLPMASSTNGTPAAALAKLVRSYRIERDQLAAASSSAPWPGRQPQGARSKT
jgi:hypothetical protein